MSGIVLHHCPESRSMRSLWLLHEIGLPFRVVTHALSDLRDPEYLAIHPLGRVPALVDGPVTLFESGAICEYLCEQYDPGMLWRWPGHADRAAWLQWLHFAETMGQHLAALTQQHIAIREDRDRSPVVMKLEARRLEKCLGVIESALGDRPYLLPGGFTAVDTGIGYGVHVARHFVDLSPYPAVAAYHARIEGRAAFRRSLPQEGAPRIYSRPFYAIWPG
ncbi:glutathione S-transferase family protein [Halovulum dunhuangense]|uniref:Glutathione S-transferase family protein n=1 Tax=Halovulum dunhuangense TaxID=1505036 RepID=A0A849L4Z8_9RHOB|nr:glutathione S-transferase family protein [Halovulum dunhuangense]NNU81207.1 glutathione S-transferase family protein [Halovulum dunhuangense]